MSNNSHIGCLVLVDNILSPMAPEIPPLLDYLHSSGFIGPLLVPAPSPHSFQVGEAFLQILTFMGCSPQIALEPSPQGGNFCYVHVNGPFAIPQLRYGQNTQPPRCNTCKGRVITKQIPNQSWHELLLEWQAHPYELSVNCSRCGVKQRPVDLNWHRQAAFGRLFVIVENIFPGEAVPVPAFLTGLKKATGISWQYFYVTELNKL